MPSIDITRPEIIKFLIETYDKTAELRMKWNTKHSEQLLQAATLHRKPKGYFELDVLEATMAAGMPTITRDHIANGRNKFHIALPTHIPGIDDLRKGNSIADVGLGDPKLDPRLTRPSTDLSPDPIMRPVDPELTKIVYKETPVYGREAYLKKRYKVAPEEKFYFQESGGWEYGWRLKDSFFSKNMTKFGRVWRLNRDLKGRTGPQPDPDHYKDSDLPGVSKCMM